MSRKDDYKLLLLDNRWKNKRAKILKRDTNSCQHCFSKTNLHVHHLVYRVKTLPWEYKNDELLTLCKSCHENVHSNSKIKILRKNKQKSLSRIDRLKMKLSKKDAELQTKYDSIKAKL